MRRVHAAGGAGAVWGGAGDVLDSEAGAEEEGEERGEEEGEFSGTGGAAAVECGGGGVGEGAAGACESEFGVAFGVVARGVGVAAGWAVEDEGWAEGGVFGDG